MGSDLYETPNIARWAVVDINSPFIGIPFEDMPTFISLMTASWNIVLSCNINVPCTWEGHLPTGL